MADMAMRAWKSAHEEAYADFCKRMDAVAKGDVSVLMDMYLMMQKCTPPEALMMYDRLSNLAMVRRTKYSQSTMGWPIYRDHSPMYHQQAFVDRCQYQKGDNRTAYIAKVRAADGSF